MRTELLSHNYQRGVFTARAGETTLQYVRDVAGLELLNSGERDLAFIGEDKYFELSLNGSLKGVNVVDTVSIDCAMVVAGPDDDGMTPVQMHLGRPMRVATSYPFLLANIAMDPVFDLRPRYVSGGCEGYVTSGLCDLVFDIKSTGETLAVNGLKIYAESKRLSLKVLDACEYDPGTAGDKLLEGLRSVAQTLVGRLKQTENPHVISYTLDLIKSQNKRVKKMGEEFGELMQALLRDETRKTEIIAEAADLLYALQVFLVCEGISLLDVLKEDIRRNQP